MTLLSHDVVSSARKVHRCDWCSGPIALKEAYVRQSIVDGREFYAWKSHLECYMAFCDLPRYEQEESCYTTYTRGCTCGKGQHYEDCTWPCDRTPYTQDVARAWHKEQQDKAKQPLVEDSEIDNPCSSESIIVATQLC